MSSVTRKRYRQSTLTNNVKKKVKKRNNIKRLEYTMTIYGYERLINGEWTYVYVGQTRCYLNARDARHCINDNTPFDKAYRAYPSEFRGPIELEQKVECREIDIDTYRDQADMLATCQHWMNEREIYYIKKHGTYKSHNGLNMTSGGQKGKDRAYFEAQLKQSESKWRAKYMPAFRASTYGKQGRLFEIPCDFEQYGQKLGKLLNHMRTEHTTIPARYLEELNAMGYNNGQLKQDCKWKFDYMTAFRASTYGKKGRLFEIPQDFEQNGQKLGRLLHGMRTGDTAIPARYLEELNAMGYNNGKPYQDCKWEIDYIPAFQASTYGKKGRLFEIPCDFEQNGQKLGRLLNDMRTRKPADRYLEELNAMGYNNGRPYKDCKWEIDYIPAIRKWCESNPNQPICKIQRKCKVEKINIGSLVYRMRKGKLKIPEQYHQELIEMGLKLNKS